MGTSGCVTMSSNNMCLPEAGATFIALTLADPTWSGGTIAVWPLPANELASISEHTYGAQALGIHICWINIGWGGNGWLANAGERISKYRRTTV
jgi:hypothetical protein